MSRRSLLTPFLVTLVAACAPADARLAPQPSPPAQSVVLAPRTPVRVQGTPLTVTLTAITDDSRCPEDVNCVWAGDLTAHLRLEAAEAAAPPAVRDAALHLNTAEREVEHGGFRVSLISVAPYPKAGETIEPHSYRATVRVEKQ